MRVALLAPLVTPILQEQFGGSQAVVADLAVELSGRGHDVVVFASRGSRIDGVEVFELDVDSTELQDVLYRADGRSKVTPVLERSFRRAYEAIGDGFDVIHNHGFDPPAVVESGALDTLVIHTLHLPPTPEMAGAIARARRSTSIYVCVSQAQAAMWGKKISVDAVIPNGVPAGRIPWERSADRYVMFAGRLSPEKGAHLAMDIAGRAGIPIVVAGPIYDEGYVREHLYPRAELPGVTMAGHLSRPRLWKYMSHARAVILPSLWEEPFGMAAAEAGAAGAPVLATRRGGLVEIVEEGVTGFFLDDLNLDASAFALGRATGLDRERIRHRAEARFSVARMASSYERLYQRADLRVKAER